MAKQHKIANGGFDCYSEMAVDVQQKVESGGEWRNLWRKLYTEECGEEKLEKRLKKQFQVQYTPLASFFESSFCR